MKGYDDNMRKILSLILTIIMIFSMSATIFAATNNTSISQKKGLYKQYESAVKEAIEKYDAKIELTPFEKFDFSTAAPIDEFKATLKGLGESEMHRRTPKLNETNALTLEEYEERVEEKMVQPMSFQTETHSDSVTVGTKAVVIDITGRFETYYSESQDRQLISSSSYISDISSATSGYTWYTTFLDESIIDGGRTFYMAAQGSVEYSNMIWYNLNIATEFSCNANGGIS